MKVRKMSYLNPDELTIAEIDYIQDLYDKLYTELQFSISFIYELASQDSIKSSAKINEIKPLITKYFYNNSDDISGQDFQKFRSLIRNNVFNFFYDIISPISQEKHHTKIYKKIIITDLYTFIPLILQLTTFYSDIAQVLYRVCKEFIVEMTIYNNNITTNEMIINGLISFNISIKLLKELLNFIKTKKINKDLIEQDIIIQKKKLDNIRKYLPKSDFKRYKFEFKNIISSFDNGIGNKITIRIKYYIYYLEKYISDNKTIIKVDNSQHTLENFIKHIETSLTIYLSNIDNLDVNILKKLFSVISIKYKITPEKLIDLLKKIIISIEIINSKLYNNANNIAKLYRYNYILYGINIIILLKKFIEYLYTDKFIIIYDKIITINPFSIDAFIPYIDYKIYPNFKLRTGDISIIDDIRSFLQEKDPISSLPQKQVKLDKPKELNTSVIFTDQDKPESIKIFIAELKLYILSYFQELLTEQKLKNNTLKEILSEHSINTRFSEILFIKNITSLFKIILFKISNKIKVNNYIITLLQYIIDLINNICIILAKNGNVNKYLLKGIINIILLTKLQKYFESDTPITYSYYDYKNVKIDISIDEVMIFILDNNLEYDLDYNIIQYTDNMIEKEYYANIDNNIKKINYQFDYTETDILGGGNINNNKYKKTENKITIIYNKRKYTRVIYICERKKYIKLNKTYMLLSKLKKI